MAYPDNHDDAEAEKQIDKTIAKLAEQYASCDRRSAEINDERATIRSNIDKLGIDPKGFVHAVAQIKQMSNGERRDYQNSVARVLSVIGDRQMELYPEAAERIKKREERKEAEAAKEGRSSEELDAATNANPRSDPDAGGAKPQVEREPLQPDGSAWPDDAAVAARDAQEQAEGDAALKAAAPATLGGKKKSQSQIAKEKLADAKLTGPAN
jgi:hypothetical protein